MKQITIRRQPKPKHKKPIREPKNEENPIGSDKIFVNLIADIVFENLLNKYRK
ncbi:hypothetical protein [Pedobacter kyonggii]|uniref:hypothetical protein n=1 Tax=Pedobacter kyonggii TaxID=1926871 RepID=UPI0013EEF313|nr:hypothetical protein [Pedobacter kyonggii]